MAFAAVFSSAKTVGARNKQASMILEQTEDDSFFSLLHLIPPCFFNVL